MYLFYFFFYLGVYSPAQGVGQPGSKVRGHNLMVPDRPACVTLLSLVRDAAARLPNGEGTRADICELMKDSQYLSTGAEASLHSVVSGALDRLHYEADPCVKYDSGRKVWIYLHRHRSEAEFGRLRYHHFVMKYFYFIFKNKFVSLYYYRTTSQTTPRNAQSSEKAQE